jgi:hypothetical protein
VVSKESAAAGEARATNNPVPRRRGADRWARKKLAGLGIVVGVAGATTAVSFASIPWYISVVLVCALAALGGLAGLAADERDLSKKVILLWCALGLALAVPIGAIIYYSLGQGIVTYPLLTKGDSAEVYDEPKLNTYAGQTISGTAWVICYITLPKTGVWYKLTVNGSLSWILASSVYPTPDTQPPQVPHC